MSSADPSALDPAGHAAREHRAAPTSAVGAADTADRYDRMLRLADELDAAGDQARAWAEEARTLLDEPALAESAALSPTTWTRVEEEIRAAASGPGGLLGRAGELDADAVALRATVHTYQWIDDLQAAAYATLGVIAGRAIGYLAPEVALGGTIVAAGLIETDELDRDEVAAYLGELAEANPELWEHVAAGGGLIESLQMRSLLSAGLADLDAAASPGGQRASGAEPLSTGFAAALRDAAVGVRDEPTSTSADAAVSAASSGAAGASGSTSDVGSRPSGLADLFDRLAAAVDPISLEWVSRDRAIVYLSGVDERAPEHRRPERHLHLVSGDHTGYADDVMRFLDHACAVADRPGLLVVGGGTGGAAAVELALRDATSFRVEEVVTANAPSALVPTLPDGVAVLSLADRTDPVALLGSLVNAGTTGRTTVVYEGDDATDGARAADLSPHPEVRATLDRLRSRGYLVGRSA